MDIIWAPWRIKYILGCKDKKDNTCFLCEKPKSKNDEENYILYRGEKAFIVMNAYPYNNGHLLIAPYRHVYSIEELTDEELLEVFKLVQKSVAVIKKVMNPDGFNIGINIGRSAGAGVSYFHVHVVPRWTGDTNFMPVLSNTKVIPEMLSETYKRLKPHFT